METEESLRFSVNRENGGDGSTKRKLDGSGDGRNGSFLFLPSPLLLLLSLSVNQY